MRIAILAPISRRIPPRFSEPEELAISDLTEGLLERGHEVFLFAAGTSLTRAELVSVCPRPLVEWGEEPWPDPRFFEELHIAECVLQAQNRVFDLVHNHMHAKALPFLAAVNIPVLTTLYAAARDRQLHPILRRFREFPFVAISEKEMALLPELNYVAEIPLPDPKNPQTVAKMLDAYEEIYEGLVQGTIPSRTSSINRITPWGRWETLHSEKGMKVKRIEINPGNRLSYQRHQHREEHWVITSGEAEATIEGKKIALRPGQCIAIPKGAAHRIANPGQEPLVFIETQLGDVLKEEDIERLEDDYGRA